MTDRSVPRHRVGRRSPRHAQPWPPRQQRRADHVDRLLVALGFGAGAALLALAVLLLVVPAVTG